MSESIGTILILAVVALSEGVRRLAPDAFVLRREFGAWRLADPFELGRELHLVAWGIPISVPVVLLTPMDERRDLKNRRLVTRLRARARRVRLEMILLRVIGTLVLLTLVVGVPIATFKWDVWGLVVALEVLLLLSATQAILTFVAMRRAGALYRPAFVASIKVLWPFTAPRGAELVQQQVIAGVPSLAVVHELLGQEEFLRAFRPIVYDYLHRDDETFTVLPELCDRETLTTFIRTHPAGASDDPFCPRCATQFTAEVRECTECLGVTLSAPRR